MLGEIGEDFPIESDVALLEHWDEFGVGETVLLEKRGHLHVPEAAEVALLIFPVSEGVSSSVEDGFVGLTFLGRAAEAVTLHLAENVPPGF